MPILGVNLGRLGFLTCCQSDRFRGGAQHLASGDYVAEPRMALRRARSTGTAQVRKQWRALNDVVLHKGGFARVVRLTCLVDGESDRPLRGRRHRHLDADGLDRVQPFGGRSGRCPDARNDPRHAGLAAHARAFARW